MIDLRNCKPVKGDPTRPDYPVVDVVGSAHVGESYSSVLRRFVVRYHKAWKRWNRDQRRLCVAMVVFQHNENRDLYRCVVTGDFGGAS